MRHHTPHLSSFDPCSDPTDVQIVEKYTFNKQGISLTRQVLAIPVGSLTYNTAQFIIYSGQIKNRIKKEFTSVTKKNTLDTYFFFEIFVHMFLLFPYNSNPQHRIYTHYIHSTITGKS